MQSNLFKLLVTRNHDLASVWFSIRLLMSPILRLVYKLHLAPTTSLLPLYALKLIAGYGVGDTTSSAYNAIVLLFTWYCCHGHSPVLKNRKVVYIVSISYFKRENNTIILSLYFCLQDEMQQAMLHYTIAKYLVLCHTS